MFIINLQALELLPPDTKIKDILTFMENVLELKAATKHQNRVLRNMLFSEALHVSLKCVCYMSVYNLVVWSVSVYNLIVCSP